MEQSLIDKINDRHIRNVDKLYRMFRGLGSRLISYKNGCIELEITLDPRWKKGNVESSAQLALEWKKENELIESTSYRVWIYIRGQFYAFNYPQGTKEEQVKEDVERAIEIGEEPRLLEVIENDFQS